MNPSLSETARSFMGDIIDLFPPERLPLVPDAVMRTHKVNQPADTRFRACARLLQALVREEMDAPIGTYRSPGGGRSRLGSVLAPVPAAAGANFLTPEIARLAYREIVYREPGALIDVERFWSNLLSSVPLTLNLFGAMKLNPALAETFVERVAPDLAGKVTHVIFEHSPARGDERFTADGTAFDVLIGLRRADGARTFLAFEVKYSENLTEPEARHRPRWDDLSRSSELFLDPEAPELRKNPLQQLWREHMLAHAMVENGLYDAGAFILLAPKLNNHVQRGASAYAAQLSPTPHLVPFINLTLEEAADHLGQAGEPDIAAAFIRRYLDFRPVHDLI